MLYFNILCLYKTNAKQKRSVFSVSVRVASVEDVDPRHVPARHGAAVAQHARRPPQLPHRGLESRDTQFGQQYLLLFNAQNFVEDFYIIVKMEVLSWRTPARTRPPRVGG